MAIPAGFENKVAFIWKFADKLRGHLKPHEYGTVMLPTLVLFRLDAVLASFRPRCNVRRRLGRPCRPGKLLSSDPCAFPPVAIKAE
jgi:hypothetical protein